MPIIRNPFLVIPIFVLLASTSLAQQANDAVQQQGETDVKHLLLLMDKDQNGKVSRVEFMNFMSAEFDRLDVNKDGELDVNELTQLRVGPTHTGGGSK